MRYGTTFTLLLLTAGLAPMATGTLRADEAAAASSCNDRLIGIEQRTLDQVGDDERCADLADQIDRVLAIF